MWASGTEVSNRRSRRAARRTRRGSALVSTVVAFVGVFGLLYASVAVSSVEVRRSRRELDELRAQHLADAGVERAMLFLRQTADAGGTQNPLAGLNNLFAGGATLSPFVATGVMDGAAQVGAYSVTLNVVEQTATSISIAIDATGYVPDAPQNLPAGRSPEAWSAVRTTVQYELSPSEVFDYGYFINNWGWFYGNTIICRGNARSNGQFDVAGYAPTVTGQPRYGAVERNGSTVSLSGYMDDNGDGLLDGNDGGVFSGWDIVGAQNLQGNGGQAQNQHDFQDRIDMPNLTDLSPYEENAVAQGGSISIGGTVYADGVLGDDAGEKQHLYLVGTTANPIVLDGPVVVRGDVVIQGVVTGQGAIYAGGNVYVPRSVSYLNGPTTTRPASNSQADTEAWLSTNWERDFLGLFARKNVVVGDHTNSTWRTHVGNWMASSLNGSAEDAGDDLIHNTRAGRDGILNTSDDDVLEGDGVFTFDVYTDEHLAMGLIPAGKSVGDAIPGTGEDINGDGVFTPTTTLADVTLTTPLDSTNFGGNIPSGGIARYRDISSLSANRIDAVIYTNHSFCWTVTGSTSARINGALVCRNENVIYGTPTLEFNYDARLLGGNSGMAAGLLPSVLREPEVLRWQRLERDPNRGLALP